MSLAVVHPPVRTRRPAGNARSWWAKAWLRAVEESAYGEAEQRRARALARRAAVGGITIDAGSLHASVEDERGLWTATTRVPTLDAPAVETLVEVVAVESGRVSALLAGDLPHPLVEHADEAGVELLPYGAELESTCTCERWTDPCEHALAMLQQTTWLLDQDPLVLLHLRGLPREELLARLHRRGPAAAEPEAGEGADEADLDLAADAAIRAARVLDALEDPDARLEPML